MPTPITPVSTWSASIPTPDDGEGATGAGLDGMAQPIANRIEFLKSLTTVSGVKRIRTFADVPTMQASAGAATGDVAYVPTVGLFYYDAASVLPDDQPWIAEHLGGGGGNWLHELAAVQSVNLATLNPSTGKLVQRGANAIVAESEVAISGGITANHFSTSSASWVDVTSASVSFTNVHALDVIRATLSTRAITGSTPTVANSCRLRLAYELLGVTTAITSTEVEIGPLAAGAPPPVISLIARKALPGVATWAAGDPHIIKLQATADGTTFSRVMFPVVLSALHIRP